MECIGVYDIAIEHDSTRSGRGTGFAVRKAKMTALSELEASAYTDNRGCSQVNRLALDSLWQKFDNASAPC